MTITISPTDTATLVKFTRVNSNIDKDGRGREAHILGELSNGKTVRFYNHDKLDLSKINIGHTANKFEIFGGQIWMLVDNK